MSKNCSPPKCATVADRCQCPNGWIEYLAHTAANRRKAGLPRLSMRSYATNYRKAAKRFRMIDVGPCGTSNTSLLCEWNLSRRISKPAAHFDLNRNILTLKAKTITKIEGSVYFAHHQGIPLVIKIFTIKDNLDKRNFLYETLVHRKLYGNLPKNIPKLYRAYFLHARGTVWGVHIMERLKGTTLKHTYKKVRNRQQLALTLKKLLDALDVNRIWHGDLHDENIFVDVSPDGDVKNVQVIDSGSSVIGKSKTNMNLLAFLSCLTDEHDKDLCTKVRMMIPHLRKVGARVPSNILNWVDEDFDIHTLVGSRMELISDMKTDPKVKLDPQVQV